ncbi:SDR family oxidoreductase [Variovorax sp. J22R115]|uniref:SDR family oxidoreductase n=1 Tax=Variovorax sp. J22R115 TaxID=3053509 RepID=UPI00257617E4|nr:SDR family oxidoreductase [Variovorax sp. J22R115]MDM0052516.1 SDR family oxidoreductase [Variovorax sp. J22R115]
MKVVIVGGSGLIGKKLSTLLRQAGHEVTSASPSSGVNTVTGEGLAQALAGAQVVVDVSNSPSFADDQVMQFFQDSTRNLLAASTNAGVGHFVALSVVGADRAPASGYLRAKVAQESLIEGGGVPYTIVRATQFFEFLMPIAQANTSGQTVRLPTGPLQPIASSDVAAALSEVVGHEPLNGIRDIAGPQAVPLDDLIRHVLRTAKDAREVVTDHDATYFGAPLTDGSLIPAGKHWTGRTSLDHWLAAEADAR